MLPLLGRRGRDKAGHEDHQWPEGAHGQACRVIQGVEQAHRKTP